MQFEYQLHITEKEKLLKNFYIGFASQKKRQLWNSIKTCGLKVVFFLQPQLSLWVNTQGENLA